MLFVRVCSSCIGDDTALKSLARAVAASDMASQMTVQSIPCGANCAKPARLWLQAEGGASYVFEGLDLKADQGDILETARAYLTSPDGWIEDARPCGRLRFCLCVRIPA